MFLLHTSAMCWFCIGYCYIVQTEWGHTKQTCWVFPLCLAPIQDNLCLAGIFHMKAHGNFPRYSLFSSLPACHKTEQVVRRLKRMAEGQIISLVIAKQQEWDKLFTQSSIVKLPAQGYLQPKNKIRVLTQAERKVLSLYQGFLSLKDQGFQCFHCSRRLKYGTDAIGITILDRKLTVSSVQSHLGSNAIEPPKSQRS